MDYLVSGLLSITWQQWVMYVVGAVLIYLAVKKEFEPSLLLPMGFGAILVNLPSSGVLNQTMAGSERQTVLSNGCFRLELRHRKRFRLFCLSESVP